MFLKNKNIIFKIRRSKVTDYAALKRLNLFNPLYQSTDESFKSASSLVYGLTHHHAIEDETIAVNRDSVIPIRANYHNLPML